MIKTMTLDDESEAAYSLIKRRKEKFTKYRQIYRYSILVIASVLLFIAYLQDRGIYKPIIDYGFY